MPDEPEAPKKTLFDRLIGSLKWGTIGTGVGALTGVGLGALAREGHFGRAFKKYASRKFPLFPTPAISHAIVGAGVGSKVGTLAGLVVGRKKKDVKELSVLLDNLIEFGSSGPMRLVRKELSLRRKGVTIYRPWTKQLESPERMVENRPLPKHLGLIKTIEHKRAEKYGRALHRVNPNVSHSDLESGVGDLYNAGPGWDKAYQKYYRGMDKHEKRTEKMIWDEFLGRGDRRLSEKINDLIEFGDYSISTAKKVIRALSQKAGHPKLFRPQEAGGGVYVVPGFSAKYYAKAAKMQDIKVKLHPHSVLVPRALPENIKNHPAGKWWSPINSRFHETGHAADPKIGVFSKNIEESKKALEKSVKAGRMDEANKIGSGMGTAAMGAEVRANREVLSQMKKHGTSEEVETWRKTAMGQMRKAYQLPMFQMVNPGTLSGGKEIMRQAPFLRKKAIQLSSLSGDLSLNSMNLLMDNLIEFKKKLYVPRKEDEPPESLPQFKPGELADYTVQEHHAKRAGAHRDIRIDTKKHGLLSWATRKELPESGGHIGIHPQPTHAHSYLGWEGEIPEGKYGAGTVKTADLKKALITHSSPEEIHATIADQKEHHRLALVKTPKGWLLARGKHPEPPKEAQKPKYKSVGPDKAHEVLGSLPEGSIVQPKVDGALVYVDTRGNQPEIFSHRKGKTSGRNIIHTERVFHGRPTTNIPRKHQRTLLGELYGTRDGKAIEPQELGGILNTHLGESIQKQKKRGVKLKIMPFDYADGKGETYPERLEKVRQTVKHLPRSVFHTPEGATNSGAARNLYQKVRSGRHPLTKEGVIIHPPSGKMIKIKNTEEANVAITGTFPGTGKFKGSHGGFTYKEGQVGTGFTDETRKTLHEHVGRIARIRHQGRYRSGAYRAPSFIGIEENK